MFVTLSNETFVWSMTSIFHSFAHICWHTVQAHIYLLAKNNLLNWPTLFHLKSTDYETPFINVTQKCDTVKRIVN
jgi:hypothetical protein